MQWSERMRVDMNKSCEVIKVMSWVYTWYWKIEEKQLFYVSGNGECDTVIVIIKWCHQSRNEKGWFFSNLIAVN